MKKLNKFKIILLALSCLLTPSLALATADKANDSPSGDRGGKAYDDNSQACRLRNTSSSAKGTALGMSDAKNPGDTTSTKAK